MSFKADNPYIGDYSNYSTKNISSDHTKTDSKTNIFTDLDDLKNQQYKLDHDNNKKDLAYLKSDILHLAKQVQNTANETSDELDRQRELLLNIDPKLNNISNNLERSDNIIGIIKNKFNKFVFWKSRRFKQQSSQNLLTKHKDVKDVKDTKDYKKLYRTKSVIMSVAKTSDEEFCDLLISQMKNIQKTNKHIGDELDNHNETVKHMTKTVNNNKKHIDELNRDIYRLLK
jgi:hypothetical protein